MSITLNEITPYSDEAGNQIIGNPKNSKVSVTFRSRNCKLVIHDSAQIENTSFNFTAPGGIVEIGEQSSFKGWVTIGLEGRLTIGKDLIVTNPCVISASERQSVTIGDGCMFATGVEIRTDDSHPIFDMATGKRLNRSKPVTIGNHVWLSIRSVILRGSTVGSGSIIGHSSVVKGEIPQNCIAAGSPARVVREGIVWDKTNVSIKPPYEFDDISTISNPYVPALAAPGILTQDCDKIPRLSSAATLMILTAFFGAAILGSLFT